MTVVVRCSADSEGTDETSAPNHELCHIVDFFSMHAYTMHSLSFEYTLGCDVP